MRIQLFALISMKLIIATIMLVLMIPISASAQEFDCSGLPVGAERGDCILREAQEQAIEEQEQELEQANANATAVTSNETINAGIYGNSTRFEYLDGKIAGMGVYLDGLHTFGQVCSDFARLRVQEETDRCIEVVGEVNSLMSELYNRHAILDKNIAIGASSLE
jgi:hypothetical protein